MNKSVAFEAVKVGSISERKMNKTYILSPPYEITRSQWKKKTSKSTGSITMIEDKNKPQRNKMTNVKKKFRLVLRLP